jgi:hypothetical protein
MGKIVGLAASIVRSAVVWAVYRMLDRKLGGKFSRGLGIAGLVLAAIADRRLKPQPVQTVQAKPRRKTAQAR